MAGKIIVDTIDTDNAFITLNVQQSLIATMNVSGIFSNTGVKMIGANGTVSNTAITGTITGSQISSNTLSNTVFQTGSVENYMNSAGLSFGMRNRIINGAMVIDQRNAGASVAFTSAAYTLDRWVGAVGTASGTTIQRSTTSTAGFSNSALITIGTGASPAAGAVNRIYQVIEGFNIADLAWGTASAATVTLSFWVRSSVTGTFSGALYGASTIQSYPFTYTISVANTFEQKTVTIAGPTTGTWDSTNGTGVYVNFDLGSGTNFETTAGAWAVGTFISATGSTNLCATSGATFYITGVQLEKGSTATSFDYRPYGTELALCQRYFISYGGVTGYERLAVGVCNTTTTAACQIFLPVPMRTVATLTSVATWGVYDGTNVQAVTSIVADQPSNLIYNASFTVASGLTANRVAIVTANNNTTARFQLSAEL